jgi:hypothetical protein
MACVLRKWENAGRAHRLVTVAVIISTNEMYAALAATRKGLKHWHLGIEHRDRRPQLLSRAHEHQGGWSKIVVREHI